MTERKDGINKMIFKLFRYWLAGKIVGHKILQTRDVTISARPFEMTIEYKDKK